ncbi:hypothetical protein SAMN05421543_11031 [Alicyclobacillus macrosporangiidus]|uniref:Uncharacterized protein n=1 Tax=Alicyclobacillus macrosporangiidus TaxID=392015 RepID=A0A1I7JHJ6_9BACL|nr:hypothetical protein SAMN05421543_11031 [Alicyclobacillus macrosporangiidus]
MEQFSVVHSDDGGLTPMCTAGSHARNHKEQFDVFVPGGGHQNCSFDVMSDASGEIKWMD